MSVVWIIFGLIVYFILFTERKMIQVEGINKERFLQHCVELKIQYYDVKVIVLPLKNPPSDLFGCCCWLVDKVCYIYLANINDDDSLFHELFHLKQQLEGRLFVDEQDIIWEGTRWSQKKINVTPYHQLPWEQEVWSECV